MVFNTEQVLIFVGSPFGGSVIAFFSTLILAPFILVVGLGLCFGLAKLMRGSGGFAKQVYLFASFLSPLMFVGGICNFIPCVGLVLLLALWLYSIMLSYFAVKALHELPRAKTFVAVLPPYVILTVVLVVTNPPSM